ncbi:MAG: ATP-binding protein [Candidatus Bathyarchaeia archaeon]
MELRDAELDLRQYSKHLEELVDERTRRLREREEMLRAIRDATPNGTILVDMAGNIVDCNQGTLKVHHYTSKDELIGKPSLILIAPKDRESAAGDIRSAWERGRGHRRYKYNLLTKDGCEFPAEVYTEFVRDTAGNPIAFVAISRDLTKQYQYEDQLRKFERMAAIGETAAIVGHDLRNPLQGITGALHVLKLKWGQTADAETLEMLELIKGALDHADKIIKELLDYSREIHLELTETTPRAVTNAALLQVKVPENVAIKNLTRDTPTLQIDEAKMQRVCLNLIANAIDAMPKGGELTMSSAASNGFLEIKFIDTGEGISERAMQNLWTPLKTTKPRGIGLGLVICKGIVEAHGGSILVESTVGKGSTFTMKLPITQNSRVPTKATS